MITEKIIAIWKREGFEYGGDWNRLKDWHHFEFPMKRLRQLEQDDQKKIV